MQNFEKNCLDSKPEQKLNLSEDLKADLKKAREEAEVNRGTGVAISFGPDFKKVATVAFMSASKNQ